MDGRVKPGHDGEIENDAPNKNDRVFDPAASNFDPPV
jgi:hypothetical protein